MTKKPTYEDLEGRIRDLEKTESENRNLKERYERITDNADEAIFLVNPEGGHVLYQNNAAERIFGFSKEEWLSDPELALKIIHPDYKEKQIQVIKEINASKKPIKNVELAWVAKNGSKVIMEYTLIPILDEDGRIVNFESIGRDITLRKQTQQSRERLFNNSVDMLCIANTEGYFKELSPAFEKTLGWAGKELMSKPFIEFVHPEDREATFERLKEQAQGKSVHHFTNRYLCKDGSYKWISWNGYSLPEEQIIFSVGRDITEWKRAEEALQKSEERYRIMADSLPNLLVIHNGEVIYYVNEAVKKLLGYSKGEVVGKSIFEFLTGDSKELTSKNIQRRIAGEDLGGYEVQIITKENKTKYFFLNTVFIPYENEKAFLVVLSDITERKQSQEALLESEKKFRTLFNASPHAIILTEIETGEIIDVNDKFSQLAKSTKKELVGKLTTQLEFFSVDKRKQLMDEFKNKRKVDGAEMEFKLKDGTIINTRIFSVPIEIEGKEFILGELHDITEQKLLQSQLRQSQKMESIGTLAGGIAHEFNNILSIIIGNDEIAMDNLPDWSPAKQNLEEIKKASFRARDVVQQLLTFSRMDISKKEPIVPVSVVKEGLKLIRSSIPANIDIICNVSDDTDPIFANATQINQILINLCSNAKDAVLESDGAITIDLENETLDEKSASAYIGLSPGRFVKLVVSDTGHGMDRETLDRIFDPYFTTKGIGRGTGTGLAVVHGIVEGHNGAISVSSEPGKGTKFTILFPAYQGQIEVEAKARVVLPTGNERILYVDDEVSIAQLGKLRLEGLGYSVQEATDPRKALEIFQTNPYGFDLVITDMAMPDMTGDQLVSEILKIRPDMPIMLCTGYSENISEEKAYELGISAFVMKPINRAELAVRVRKVLDESIVSGKK